MNDLENQIKDEIFQYKISKLYNRFKYLIVSTLFLILIFPILLQIFIYYENNKKQNLLSNYLKAENLINSNERESILILDSLVKGKDEITSILSSNKLIDYYLEKKQSTKLIDLINYKKLNYKEDIFLELKKIQNVLINFDNMNESEILALINLSGDMGIFKTIKRQIIYDFYIKNQQIDKARQILPLGK